MKPEQFHDAGVLPTVECLYGNGTPNASVIWLHGLGADGFDFVPIVNELYLPQHQLRFVFPHAPQRPVTINMGMMMRAWYDIEYIHLDRKIDKQGVRDSEKEIIKLIARENARGIPTERIVLAGFSQGGAIVLQTGLNYSEKLAGILALSTYLAIPEDILGQGVNHQTPLFYAHGTQDPVVPLGLANKSRDILMQHGFNLTTKDYPMPHAVYPQEITDISQWLQTVLPPVLAPNS